MKKILVIISLLFIMLLSSVPVFADTTTCTPEEITAGTCIAPTVTDITLLQDIKTIEQGNQELLLQQTSATLIIMYILAIISVMIYVFLLFLIVRKIAKFLGFGLL